MVKRISHQASNCPIARSLDAIGDWWSLLIVREAMGGKRRFSEFQKSIGIAKNILAARLRRLEAHGILQPAPAADGGPHHEYLLTAKGRALFPVLIALRQWGESFSFEHGETCVALLDRLTGQPLRPLEPRAQDGRMVGPEDMELRRPEPPAPRPGARHAPPAESSQAAAASVL
jgi:DNA-binding HxlR family transcriptional regulator